MPDVANQVSYEQRVLAADPNATGTGLTGKPAGAMEHLPGADR
jgi:hypothetical protein